MGRREQLRAAAAAGLLWFLILAWWVMCGGSKPFDLAIREAVNARAVPALTHVMQAITTLGAGEMLWPLGALIVFALARRRTRAHAIWFAIVVLSADLVSQLFKLLFHRARPAVFFGLSPAESYSFPSGHAYVATVFYGALTILLLETVESRSLRVGGAVLIITLALLVGLSRVYLGYHYPSDVLGGWALADVTLAVAALRPVRLDRQAREK